MAGNLRGPVRVAVVSAGGVDGDSRALRVAGAARAAGYLVTLVGQAPATVELPGVEIRQVTVRGVLGTHRVLRPRPGLRWPLAYRSSESYEHRTTLLAAERSLLRTRGAGLALVHRPLPLRALAHCGYAVAWLRHTLRAGWTRARAAQHRTAVRRRKSPDSRLDNLITGLTRLLLGHRAWRRLDPGLLDDEVAYGPVLDAVRPHLIHAHGHRALAVASRAALRAEASGHRVEVVWDAPPRTPTGFRRADAAADAHERAFAREADGVVTVGDRLARELRSRYGLATAPTVARNTPPLGGVVAPPGARGGAPLASEPGGGVPAVAGDATLPGGGAAPPGGVRGVGRLVPERGGGVPAVASVRAGGGAAAERARGGVPGGVAPPAAGAGRSGGVRARCHLGADVPLLVHTGPVTPDRGPATVIEALPKLYDLHAAFVVPDPAHPHLAELRERAAELGVDGRLHVLPYVPVADIPDFLSSADIGVLPVHKLPHHQSVLATRYFEYAHARLPVVVSDVRAMSAATLELGNGEVFRAADTADFVRAVGAVLTNPRRYRKAYDRADILRQWSWQTESAPLLDLYARLLGPTP